MVKKTSVKTTHPIDQVNVLESITDAFFALDNNFKFIYMNGRVQKMFGFKYADIAGKTIEEVFPSIFGADVVKIIKKSQKSKKAIHRECFSSTFNKWYQVGLYPSTEGISLYINDITLHKIAVENLKSSEDRYRSLVETANVIPWESSFKTGNFTYVGPQVEKILGYKVSEWYDNSFWEDHIHPDDRDWVIKSNLDSREKKKHYELEYRMIAKNGAVVWLRDMATVAKKDGNRFLSGFMIDITERKMTEFALAENEAKYKMVVENVTDLVRMVDEKGRFQYVSPSYKTLLGYDTEDLLGTILFDYIHPEDMECFTKQFNEVLHGNLASVRYRFKHKYGHYLILEGSGKAILDSNNNPFLVINTSHDMTSRIELERRKDEFISVASHELKTPVTSIKGFIEVLQMLYAREEKPQYFLTKMAGQIDRLIRLINDLLDVSKVQSGKLVLEKEETTIDSFIKEIIEEIQLTNMKHLVFVDCKANCQINIDKYRVGQVLINIISNAIKYSPKADKVLISTRKKGSHVVIKIQDFGIGISKRDLQKIFEPFFQANNNIRQSYSGLGLGLHISNEIIERHNGKIEVESEKGKGSTFTISLPCGKIKPITKKMIRTNSYLKNEDSSFSKMYK